MRHIAILRGINVSGRNKILMKDLKDLLENNNFFNVETYIQSGNIAFDSDETIKNDKLEQLISNLINIKYSYRIPTIVRTQNELIKIIENNPFEKDESIKKEKLYFTFLKEKPKKENINKLSQNDYSPDIFKYSQKVVYLHVPDKYGNTKLSNTFFERKLKVSCTTRNWKTTMKLLGMCS